MSEHNIWTDGLDIKGIHLTPDDLKDVKNAMDTQRGRDMVASFEDPSLEFLKATLMTLISGRSQLRLTMARPFGISSGAL